MNDGEKIMELMMARGLSQNGFAKETGIAQSYISYIVNGKKTLSDEMKVRICKALDIDMAYFNNDDEIKINKVESTKKEDDTQNEIRNNNKKLAQEDMTDYSDILSVANELQKNRNKVLDMIKIEREKLKYYSDVDVDFLHKIENIEDLSDDEAIKIVIDEKKSRKERRMCKNRTWILQNLLNKITIPNPYGFVVEGINATKTYEYKKRTDNRGGIENGNN